MNLGNSISRLLVLVLLPLFVSAQYSEKDWEERDTWMHVDSIFQTVGISKGYYVADIGCHEGYLSVHLAKEIGSKGRVYAVDVREDRLDILEDNLKSRSLANVDVILGDYDNPKLPKNKLDVVFIMDTYHEMTDYKIILQHVNTALKTGGKLVVIEKLKSRIKGQSRAAQVDAHSLSPNYVKEELIAAGFNITYQDNDMGDWEDDEEKVIWMLIAKKE